MSASCIGAPVSWLKLERYELGELSADDATLVREHLDACAACAAALSKIKADGAAPLPKLQKKRPARARVVLLRRAGLVTTGLAMAAAVLLWIGIKPTGQSGNRIKGGDVSFVLVREDETVFAEAGVSFRDGDRFKMVVTCPPGSHVALDAVVWDSAGASFPLTVPSTFQCGNGVALPGAFRVTGTDVMTVCLLVKDADAIDREDVRRGGRSAMSRETPCKTLTPR
jgi:hypothetical protein